MLTRRVVGDPGAPDRGRSGKVVNFLKHQRINRPNASKLKDYWEFSECSVSTHGALSEDSHPEGKGRGREEEGKRNRNVIRRARWGRMCVTDSPAGTRETERLPRLPAEGRSRGGREGIRRGEPDRGLAGPDDPGHEGAGIIARL